MRVLVRPGGSSSPQRRPLREQEHVLCFNLKLLRWLLIVAAYAANCGSSFTLDPHSRFMEMMSVGTI